MCNTTTTSTQTPSPTAASAYTSALELMQSAANRPFNPYPNNPIVPLNPEEYKGIGSINNYAQAAQPGLNYASGLNAASSMPLSASTIQQYMSPYIANVVNTTQGQFNYQNAQAAKALKGQQISQGTFGGNSGAIGLAALQNAQQTAQAPIIANLENTGYNTALGTAMGEQQVGQSGASIAAQLAMNQQMAGLSGAQQQIGAGQLEQQNQQAYQNWLLSQFQAQQAYPFQVANFYTQGAGSLGPLFGGTTSTTAPFQWGNLVGGTAALGAGLFLRDGGVVGNERATGGVIGRAPGGATLPYDASSGLYGMQPGSLPGGAQEPNFGFRANFPAIPSSTTPQSAQNGVLGLTAKQLEQIGHLGGSLSLGEGQGTIADALSDTAQDLGDWRGGGVRGYADGGGDDDPPASFSDRFAPAFATGDLAAASSEIPAPLPAPSGVAPAAPATAAPVAGVVAPDVPMPRPRPSQSPMSQYFGELEDQYDLPHGYLSPVAKAESSYNPRSYNELSGAKGMFQFIPKTQRSYPHNPWDWRQSADAAARYASDNAKGLRAAGLPVTPGTLYLAHQQGLGGAIGLLTHPNARAVDTVPYWKNITANGGNMQMSAAQFANMWENKIGSGDVEGPEGPRAGVRVASNGVAPASDIDQGDTRPLIDDASQEPGVNPERNVTRTNPSGVLPAGLSKFLPVGMDRDKLKMALIQLGAGALGNLTNPSGIGIGLQQAVAGFNTQKEQEVQHGFKQQQLDNEVARLNWAVKHGTTMENIALSKEVRERQQHAEFPIKSPDPEKPDMTGVREPDGSGYRVFKTDGTLGPKLPWSETTPDPAGSQHPPEKPPAAERPAPPSPATPATPPPPPARAVPPSSTPEPVPAPEPPKTAPPVPSNQVASISPQIPVAGMTFGGQKLTQAQVTSTAEPPPKYNEEALKDLSPEGQRTVKALVNYDMLPSQIAVGRGEKPQALKRLYLDAARNYDKTYQPAQAAYIAKNRNAWIMDPKHGDAVRSFSTAISHIELLKDIIANLHNQQSPKWNALVNHFKAEFAGQAMPTNFDAAVGIIGDEIVKSVVPGQNALGDRQEVKTNFNRNGSPDQQMGVINVYEGLMAGQLHSLERQYLAATKASPEEFHRLLSPEANDVFYGHGSAATFTKAEPKDRFNQLRREGKTVEQAHTIMSHEGY